MTLEGRVLVTGGTGSLGQALVERLTNEESADSIAVYSRDEVKQASMRERFPDVRYLLGDVQDAETLGRAMASADVVIHAAAYKRVPEAERETLACVSANVVGSANVVREAIRHHVPRVVGISTDKACAPLNVYGMTKGLMERLFVSADRTNGTDFHLVRYGNVLASRGSVVPVLRSQAERGGPITLTDPAMTRFWLTLDDAVDLVIRSLELPPGDVLIPRCPASSMATLAEAIAPGVPVSIIGRRDAEKTDESLLSPWEAPYARKIRGGWALSPLGTSLDPDESFLQDVRAYTSADALQLDAETLRDAIEGRRSRLLA